MKSHSKYILLLITIGCLLGSCKSIKESRSNVAFISLDEVNVSNDHLLTAIETEKQNFQNTLKKVPKTIVVQYFKSLGELSIESFINFYFDEEDMKFINDAFIGGMMIGETLIVFKNIEMSDDLVRPLNRIRNFPIELGGNMTSCRSEYKIHDGLLHLEKNVCPDSIHTK